MPQVSNVQLPSPIDMTNRRFVCRSPGIAATTEIWKHGAVYRVGIAIMGSADPGSDNPFDSEFCDNYIEAIAPTEEEAVKSIEEQMKKMSESLWV